MHVVDRLQARLAGTLPADQSGQVDAHLAACAECRAERDLLQRARSLIAPLPAVEPRAGFAAMVALNARDRRAPLGAWLRWSLSGLALAAAAAVGVAVLTPRTRPAEEPTTLAQRLDLYEDMAVMQNQDALEDLDVVSVLHTLEARP
jgi:anti-sigma factor RsiW